jgi:FSR family fosmidomycin resistance protein-like MFS transporter
VVALLLAIAGLSSSVFHPAAAAWVTRAAGRQWGRATSYFMTGGELARAAGPLLIAAVLAEVGLGWSWVVVAPGLLASLALSWLLARRPILRVRHPASPLRPAFLVAQRGVVLLSVAGAFLATAISALLIFAPTYLVGAGADILFAGAALTSFEIGGAAGAFLGGTLSDRIGRRAMLAVGTGIGAPLLALALLMPPTPVQLAAFALAGLVFLTAGPVQLVMIQELLPDNRSMAVAISIVVSTVAGALGTVIVGGLAELISLQGALVAAAASALLALPCIAFLPETRHVSRGHAA